MARALLAALIALAAVAAEARAIRVASYNVALAGRAPGEIVQRLRLGDDPRIAGLVAVIGRVRPDILLVNELDHDREGAAAALLARALREGAGPDYPHRFVAPVNTGVPTGLDLDGDGDADGPGDAQGWGRFEGQYGMALFSRWPIGAARTFQRLPWAAMPDNLMPEGFYPEGARRLLRLSSKSHWALAVDTPEGRLHLFASHPTPPVFDGPEDRNGRRNADEIRFWTAYAGGAGWIVDDAGGVGGHAGGPFVILGDLNADPEHGDGRRAAIAALLAHPMVADPAPTSAGAPPQRPRATTDWEGPGPLRADYALPSADLRIEGASVFWPAKDDPDQALITAAGSDHRLVWVDVDLP